jgi:6-phosphogluconate dehydrogenase
MGQNLVLNVESRGFAVSVAVQPHVASRPVSTEAFVAAHPGKRIVVPCHAGRVRASLARPRKVMLMVKAGAAVDAVIEQLLPLLEPGDIVIDGGNSLYTDTERRDAWLGPKRACASSAPACPAVKKAHARARPSCPAGRPAPGPRCARSSRPSPRRWTASPASSTSARAAPGHYVKMIHNGIEYGDMQLICEAYALFKAAGMTADEMAAVFDQWNEGELQSYLIQITAKALEQVDPETGRPWST